VSLFIKDKILKGSELVELRVINMTSK